MGTNQTNLVINHYLNDKNRSMRKNLTDLNKNFNTINCLRSSNNSNKHLKNLNSLKKKIIYLLQLINKKIILHLLIKQV